jgi:hypothetical protein
MGGIYKRAEMVMVDLGEDTKNQDSGAAMSIIRSWAECDDQYSHREYLPGSDGGYGKSFEMLPSLSHGNHLVSFFERPWWNRVWTLQEIFHSNRAFILCGKHNIEWSDIVKAAHLWRDIDYIYAVRGHDEARAASTIYKSGLAAKVTFASMDGPRGSFSRVSWLSILASTVKFASKDPRDKLYALASMSKAIPGFEISYTKPMAEVFKDFTNKYQKQRKDLEFLQLAGVNHEEDPELPTWIPNFENLDHPMLDYHDRLQNDHFATHIENSFKVWNASCKFTASLQQSTADSESRPEGVRVGTIDEVCMPSNNNGTDPGWLNLAHKRFGTEYHPPTMSCHILQVYFRILFGDRYEITNE